MATGIKHKAVGVELTQAEFENDDTHEVDAGISESTFIVYKEGSTYYARKVEDGTTPYSGADAGAVIQSSVTAMTDGGVLFLRAGAYSVGQKITIPVAKSIIIRGEGHGYATTGTVLTLANSVNDHMFYHAGSTSTWWVGFEHLTLLGNSANQSAGSGVYIAWSNPNRVSDLWMEDVFIRDFKEYGAYFASVWSYRLNGLVCENNLLDGCRVDAGSYAQFINCYFSGNTQRGLTIQGGDCQILNTACTDNGYQGYLSTGHYNTYLGGWIYDNSQVGVSSYAGMRITGDYNKVLGVDFDGNSQEIYAIDLTATAERTVIKDCTYTGHTSYPIADVGVDTVLDALLLRVVNPDVAVGQHRAKELPDNTDTTVYIEGYLPLSFHQLVSADLLLLQTATAGSPNMVWTMATDFGKLDNTEAYNTHEDTDSGTDGLTQNILEKVNCLPAFTGLGRGDVVGIEFTRDGDHASDTVNASVYLLGLRLRYV